MSNILLFFWSHFDTVVGPFVRQTLLCTRATYLASERAAPHGTTFAPGQQYVVGCRNPARLAGREDSQGIATKDYGCPFELVLRWVLRLLCASSMRRPPYSRLWGTVGPALATVWAVGCA
jgi:hypothetical protein